MIKPRTLGSDKILMIFLNEKSTLINQNALASFKMVLFSSFCRSIWFLSKIYSEDLVELLKVKLLPEMWEDSYSWVPMEFFFFFPPMEFLTLIVIHTEHPAICQLQFIFFYPGTYSCRDF